MIHSRDIAPPHTLSRKPRDDEIDVYGITDIGKARADNQDHFVICSLSKRLNVWQSSLPGLDQIPLAEERVAFLAMIVAGVGVGMKGDQASRTALVISTRVLDETRRCLRLTAA